MKAVLCCILTAACALGAGRVETRDSVVHRGEITFDDGAVQVRPTSGPSVRIAIDKVRSVTVRDAEPQSLASSDTGELSQPWMNADIGKVHDAGSVTCDGKGIVMIAASGWGVLGASDSLHWAYRTLEADGQIIARIRAADRVNGAMVSGVMIRQNLDANSHMVVACIAPQGRISLQRRIAGRPVSLGPESDVKGDIWLRLTRRGTLFTAYDSADGQTWRRFDSCNLPVAGNVLAGVAAWKGGNSGQGRAVVDSVSLIPGTAGSTGSLTEAEFSINEGAVLKTGATHAGAIASADDGSVVLTRGNDTVKLATTDVAQLVLDGAIPQAATGRTGVLLRKGDFVEGEVTTFNLSRAGTAGLQGQITVTSVLFGPVQVAAPDAAVVYMRDVRPSDARYEIRTSDGSRVFANAIEFHKTGVVADAVEVAAVVSILDRRANGTD